MEIRTINLGFVNSYLIKTGEGFVLIDTGIPGARPKISKALEDAGCTAGNLKLIILTHGDNDHSGNASFLRGKYKTKIAMHKNDSDQVETGNLGPERKVKSVFMRLMHVFLRNSKRFREMILAFEKFKPDIYLEDGQSLNEYGLDAKVLHLPGHTMGSIGVISPDGNFFSGDTIVNRGGKAGTMIIMDEEALDLSLKKIKELNIKNIYPGHGKPFKA